jgi:hypothetical protein
MVDTAVLLRISLVGLLFSGGDQLAAVAREATVVECPETIGVNQDAINVPSTWNAMPMRDDASYRLVGVSMFDGPPSFRRELKPTVIKRQLQSKEKTFTFKFAGQYSQGVFVACRYESTSMIVYKEVLPLPKQCSFAYRQTVHGLRPLQVSCQ